MILNAVSTLKNENGAKITLVSTLKKALIQKLFSVSAAGKNLKEKILFVSTFLDKYRAFLYKLKFCGILSSCKAQFCGYHGFFKPKF